MWLLIGSYLLAGILLTPLVIKMGVHNKETKKQSEVELIGYLLAVRYVVFISLSGVILFLIMLLLTSIAKVAKLLGGIKDEEDEPNKDEN